MKWLPLALPLSQLGLAMPAGWRLWAPAAAIVAIAGLLVTRSLWPGIVLHAALDFVGGWIALLILREPAAASALKASDR